MNGTANRNLRVRRSLALAGTGLVLGAGLIHLVLTPEHLEQAPYLGLLFLADFVGAMPPTGGQARGGW